VIVVSSLYIFSITLIPISLEFFKSRIGAEIYHATAPLISVSLASLTYLAGVRGSVYRKVALIAGFFAIAALMSTLTVKAAVFILAACILLYVVVTRPRLFKVISALALLVVFLIASLTFLQFGRSLLKGITPPLVSSVVSKVIIRQTTSGMCLQKVMDKHWGKAPQQSPYYFAAAIVPRVLWPQKPALSRGHEFNIKYCSPNTNPDQINDLSVTLAGEPIIEAGVLGLVTAQLFLAIGLVVVTVGFLKFSVLGYISMAALLPWLVDFDANFSLYFANSVKMFLIMLPSLILIYFMMGKDRRAMSVSGLD
jgi:hypothetical protein